ncbi:MAG: hypothetical protein QNJ72_40515 [Pleurocapsa sp. MO_226.B13]|nr:hypothetical protein [Pleurocapsa sp. MO_226.B13]
MSVVKSDLQKLEALLKSATNQRQRKMYQCLLDKARKEIAHQESAQSEEDKRADNLSSRSPAPRSDQPVEDNRKQKKQKKQKTEQALSTTDLKSVEMAELAQSSDLSADTKEPVQELDQSQGESQSKLVEQPNIFQAVGSIKCTPKIKEDKLFITIGDREYELKRGVRWSHKHFDQLKEEIEQNGSTEVCLRVYPNIIHDSENKEIRYWFTLVKANLERSDSLSEDEGFIFRGIWQYVSYCCDPVISVYRNIDNLKFYHRLSFKAKKAFARPMDFPVVWSAPVKPFQYNPELNQKEQMTRYFVQVRAVFEDGRFKVVEIISEATLDIPKYIKPPRNKTKSQSQSVKKN